LVALLLFAVPLVVVVVGENGSELLTRVSHSFSHSRTDLFIGISGVVNLAVGQKLLQVLDPGVGYPCVEEPKFPK
jgi:hypothetical protein